MQRLCDSVQEAWTQWQSACTRAQETRAVNDLHAFRIATKDLRYWTELLYDVGHRQLKGQLKWPADLQDAIGVGTTAKCSMKRLPSCRACGYLAERAAISAHTLAELEKDRSRQGAAVDKIFRLATNYPGRQPMESWNVNPLTPDSSPLT